jgi:hypothetical protein
MTCRTYRSPADYRRRREAAQRRKDDVWSRRLRQLYGRHEGGPEADKADAVRQERNAWLER